MNDVETLFFGCQGESGHYLWTPTKARIDNFLADRLRLPRPGQLDANALLLPSPETLDHASLTYLPAPDLTILAWWGSPYDIRGKVNSAIITRGQHKAFDVWVRFVKAFPDLAQHLTMPKVVAGDPS